MSVDSNFQNPYFFDFRFAFFADRTLDFRAIFLFFLVPDFFAAFFVDFVAVFFAVFFLAVFFGALAACATAFAALLTRVGIRLATAVFAFLATAFTAVSVNVPAALAAKSVIWSMIGFFSPREELSCSFVVGVSERLGMEEAARN